MPHDVQVRRVYDSPGTDDGIRVLVDGLWPRGVAKDGGRFDEWLREVAPSSGLRTWYGHKPERFSEFRRRYLAELHDPDRAAAVDRLRDLCRRDRLTLVTATKDADHSQAAVLADLLQREP
jgi:uncharacterized protein YeaO (DUF488 family)